MASTELRSTFSTARKIWWKSAWRTTSWGRSEDILIIFRRHLSLSRAAASLKSFRIDTLLRLRTTGLENSVNSARRDSRYLAPLMMDSMDRRISGLRSGCWMRRFALERMMAQGLRIWCAIPKTSFSKSLPFILAFHDTLTGKVFQGGIPSAGWGRVDSGRSILRHEEDLSGPQGPAAFDAVGIDLVDLRPLGVVAVELESDGLEGVSLLNDVGPGDRRGLLLFGRRLGL